MASDTTRWRGSSRVVYSLALLELVRYARQHPDPDFAFGPMDLDALEAQGLSVSGSSLTGVSDVLRQVPGLAEVSA